MTLKIFKARRIKTLWVAAIFVTAFCALGAQCEPGALIRLTNQADGGSASLRAAITKANNSSSPVRIEIPAGTYQLSTCGADDDNTGGDLDVTTSAPVALVATGSVLSLSPSPLGMSDGGAGGAPSPYAALERGLVMLRRLLRRHAPHTSWRKRFIRLQESGTSCGGVV
jgi:hypothetical protein